MSALKQFWLIFCLLLLGAAAPSYAQCPENFTARAVPNGRPDSVFCVGQTIRFSDCTGLVDPDKERYIFDTQPGSQFPNDTGKVHQYNQPGTYVVTQGVNQTGVFVRHTRTIRILPTPQPQFKISSCTQNGVSVTLTDTVYSIYRIDFGDGNSQNISRGSTITHNYTGGGSRTITLSASYSNNRCTQTAQLTYTPLPVPTAPKIDQLEVLQQAPSGQLQLNFSQLSSNFIYVLEQANGSGSGFTFLDTLPLQTSGSYTYTHNTNTTSSKCYRLRVTDVCNTDTGIFSNITCSESISISSGNKLNNISWNAYPLPSQLIQYRLYANNQLISTQNTNTFRHDSLACGRTYCYRVEAVLQNQVLSRSGELCQVTTSTTKPAAATLYTTFNLQNQLEVHLDVPENEAFSFATLLRSIRGGAFVAVQSEPQPVFTDNSFTDFSQQPCYQVEYTDSCGLTAPRSNVSCPVVLQATLSQDRMPQLTWTSYQGFTDRIFGYEVQLLDAQNQLITTYPLGNVNSFTDQQPNQDNQIVRYRVKVLSVTGDSSFSNYVELVQQLKVFVPNAFSPNGDGLNDIFEVKGRFLLNFELTIFNRWGQVVFESKESSKGWDGTVDGSEAPTGVYAYRMVAIDEQGRKYERNGTITLLR